MSHEKIQGREFTTSATFPRKFHNMAAIHDRRDRQIATAPLRQRVQQRGPLREDKLTHPAPVSALRADLSGLGDEVRNLIRRLELLERDYEELRERVERIEKGTA